MTQTMTKAIASRLTLLALAVLAAGCSSRSDRPERTATTDQAVSTVCGAGPGGPVQGYDVSRYQGSFDWNAARANGVAFGYASVGDGMSIDSMFDQNWANMGAAGVYRGAYQFFEPGDDPVAQANILIQKVGVLGAGDLPPMIDVEVTGGQSGGTIAARVRTWMQVVQQGTGKAPIIYTGPYFWDGSVGDTSFGNTPLWTANYGVSCPLIPNGWGNWTIWQYSDGGGALDHDVFNGDLAALQAFAGVPQCIPHCQDNNTIIGADCGAGNCAQFGSQCVDDNLGARCVFSLCPAQGGATICLPGGAQIGTCANGALTQGDCAAYGSTCVDDNLGARCVFYACPAQGTSTYCRDQGMIANCDNGAVSFGDCGQFGSSCVNDNLGARCVFYGCPAQGDTTVCMPDGHTLGTCHDGGIAFGDCAVYGSTCVKDQLPARCVFYACPADGDKTVCVDGHTVGSCHDGAVQFQDCQTSGATCAMDGQQAYCKGPLSAKLVARQSPAAPDASRKADYQACAGQEVTVTFDVQDIGTLPWTDVNDLLQMDLGKAVRLGTSDGGKRDFPDPFTGNGRLSLSKNVNPDVSPTGPDCDDRSGCDRTLFTVSGKAPSKAGIYTTTWQLVDETRAWFGPVMAATFRVSACPGAVDAGAALDGAPITAPGNRTSPELAEGGSSAPRSSPGGGCSVSPTRAEGGCVGLLCTLGAGILFGRRRAFKARDGLSRSHSNRSLCLVATDRQYLMHLLSALSDRHDCYRVKCSTLPQDGMYIGRAFMATKESAGRLWAQYRNDAKLMCSLQDDELVGRFRQATSA